MISEIKRRLLAQGANPTLVAELCKKQFDAGYKHRKNKELESMYDFSKVADKTSFCVTVGGRGHGRGRIVEKLIEQAALEEERKQRTEELKKVNSVTLPEWLKEQPFILHPQMKMYEEFFKYSRMLNNDDQSDAVRYGMYVLGQWGKQDNIMKCETCPHSRLSNMHCALHGCGTAVVDKAKECLVKEDKMLREPKFAKAKKQHYYDRTKHKGVSQGDIVFVEHPNKDMEGWYIKSKCDDGTVRYNSIDTVKDKQYNLNRLESNHQPAHGTMIYVARGKELVEVLRRLYGALSPHPAACIAAGIKIQSLKPTKEEQVRPLQDALTEFTIRYNHNVAEANKVKVMLEQINQASNELAAKMHDIDTQIKEMLNE